MSPLECAQVYFRIRNSPQTSSPDPPPS